MSIGRVPGDTGIQPTIVDAKGDIIAATAADSVSRLAVGTNNQVLMADSAQATGLKYANEATATLTTTGDLLYASAANTPARLAIGSTNQVLTVSGVVPTRAAAATGGKLLQIVEASYGTEVNTTSTTLADLGLSASITPSATSSKVLILGVLNVGKTTTSATTGVQSRLFRGTTEISAITSGAVYNDTDGIRGVMQPFMYLDSPSTTSSTTYKVQIASTDGGNVIFNFNYSGTLARCRIFLLEIGA